MLEVDRMNKKRTAVFADIPQEIKESFDNKLKIEGIKTKEFIEACIRLFLEEKTFQEKIMRKVKEIRKSKLG